MISFKTKAIGLGICCLAFSFTGITKAGVIGIEDGKYGKHFDTSCKQLDACRFIDFKFDLKDLLKDLKDIKDDKGCKDDKYGKDVCKVDWGKKDDKFCFGDDKKHDCDVVICDKHDHDCHVPCDPHAVPAPAASLTSGLGVIGVALAGWLKNRRSVKA